MVVELARAKLSEEQIIHIVSRTWLDLSPHVAKFPFIFYNKFWEEAPETKPLFAGKAIKTQGSKLVQLFQMVVEGLEDLEKLRPTLESLARKHVAVGVKTEMFEPLGKALMSTLEQLLGKDFTPEVRESWQYVYDTLATKMKLVVEEEYAKLRVKELSKATLSQENVALQTIVETRESSDSPVSRLQSPVVIEKPASGGFWSNFHLCKFYAVSS